MIIGYPVPSNPNKLLKGPYPLLEMEELLSRGHTVIPIPYNFEEAYKGLIKKCDFIIVHRLGNGERWRKFGIPYGVIFHGADKRKKPVARTIDRIPECKWIGYITDYNKELLERWKIKKKLVYTPNVVRTDFFSRTKPLGDKIITGGRFIPAKQFELVSKAIPDSILFGGNGEKEYRDYLYKTVKNILGWLNANELKRLYDDSWLFIHPSKHPGEGAPKVVLEAMLMELQILTTPKGGTKYFEGVTFLSSNPTVEEIRDKVRRIDKVPNKIGRSYVLRHHHPKIFVDNILKAIDESI